MNPRPAASALPTIPHSRHLCPSHLLLQLKYAVQKCLRSWWTSWHINIHWHYSIDSPYHAIAIVIIAAAICTTSHANNPLRVWHLVIALTKRRTHFIRHSARYNHHIGLARGCPEYDTQTVLVVAGHGDMHHFEGTASKSEAKWPH